MKEVKTWQPTNSLVVTKLVKAHAALALIFREVIDLMTKYYLVKG